MVALIIWVLIVQNDVAGLVDDKFDLLVPGKCLPVFVINSYVPATAPKVLRVGYAVQGVHEFYKNSPMAQRDRVGLLAHMADNRLDCI